MLSGHDFFSRVCSRGERERERERKRERERERERERVDRTYRWRKFRFQWLSQRPEEGQERLEVQMRGAWSGKATLMLLLFASTKFCDFEIPMILRVLIFATSRRRAKFCDFEQPR